MKSIWRGEISLNDSESLEDVRLDWNGRDGSVRLLSDASLRFLSIVETASIPLYLIAGPSVPVETTAEGTERWFDNILLGHNEAVSGGDDHPAWWKTARQDSPLAILVAADYPHGRTDSAKPAVTELLFFASRDRLRQSTGALTPPPSSPNLTETSSSEAQEQPKLRLRAIPLSSDLHLHDITNELTPPSSPLSDREDVPAIFLPSTFDRIRAPANVVNQPPVRKRKSVHETFDEASERRRKARRKGGEGVAAAAAQRLKTEDSFSSFQHFRSLSNSRSTPLPPAQLSRASSVSSARPDVVREPSVSAASKRSTLSNVLDNSASAGVISDECTESKNKQLVSRHVMAGMRLHGLSQSKSGRSRANSAGVSPSVDTSFEDVAAQQRNDEEHKLIYHQVFKGVCFAFRDYIGSVTLQLHVRSVQDTVDKLLAIFCNDPLGNDVSTEKEKLTPGGRKIFGSTSATIAPEQR